MTRTKSAAGARSLFRVALGADRVRLAPFVAIVAVLSASSILAYLWIFPDDADRIAVASTLGSNPALTLVFGQARELVTADGFNAWRAGQLGALLAGVMGALAVVRNTRGEEDSDRAELIASSVLPRAGRLAVAAAISTVAAIAVGLVSFLLTVLCGGGLLVSGLLSATFAVSAFLFGAVAALACQIGSDARVSSTIAIGIIAVTYVIRGYLDFSESAAGWIWLSPFGWFDQTLAATENRWWPLLLALGVAVLLYALSFALESRRDYGRGLIAQRPGPARAKLSKTAWGLALKLHGGVVGSWLLGFAIVGGLFGNVVTTIGSVLEENPLAAAGTAAPQNLTFVFLSMFLQVFAIIAAIMGVQVVMRIYDEETAYRAEPLLATPLRRRAFFASHAVIALLGPALGLIIAGTSLGLVATSQDPSLNLGQIIGQAAVTVLAVWVLVGLALAAVGAAPQRRIIGWAGVLLTFALTIIGPTFNLWNWALSISPLRHVPNLANEAGHGVGWIWLIGITVALLTAGFAGYRRRDII